MNKFIKIFSIVAIVFMGLTAAMNILGGVGTSCAAFFTRDYPPMWNIIREDVQWLYQAFVIITVPLGIVGVWATINLIRRKRNSYRNALILLVLGSIVAGIHMYVSLDILGKAVPANMKFYSNAVTLLIFLIFLLPGIRGKIDFSEPSDDANMRIGGGLAAIVTGIITLTVALWAGPSHMFQGENWVLLLQLPLTLSGVLLILGGIGGLIPDKREKFSRFLASLSSKDEQLI
ncbi:MAG: hypothetical protein IBX69_14475 [Anaerolineales bacterium]|nr:hypothetical protein [Anaerolineales bacterium]